MVKKKKLDHINIYVVQNFFFLHSVHKNRIKAQLHPPHVSDDQSHKIHMEKFCDWFREHVSIFHKLFIVITC